MRKFLLNFLIVALPLLSVAQSTLTGTVKNKSNPVVGASVSVSPSGKTTATDANGKFKLSLASGVYKVTVSYVGFTTTTVSVTLNSNETKDISVELEEGVSST